ncbi:50S ribosomal protein L7/L12 [bacterium]|nr:50S ribosomal protein L7/L12 [bacterium]
MTTNITQEDVISYIENITVLELSKLIKTLEEKFGVSASAGFPMGMMPVAGGAADPSEEKAEEKTTFDVILTGFGDKKIPVIKEVRAIISLGLKEAKELVEACPKPIKEGVSKEEAEDIKSKLEKAGATIEIK